jgi:hypothetical protein
MMDGGADEQQNALHCLAPRRENTIPTLRDMEGCTSSSKGLEQGAARAQGEEIENIRQPAKGERMISNFIEHAELTERALRAVRLSFQESPPPSTLEDDLRLALRLMAKGQSHVAALRQTFCWFHLRASRSIWQEWSKHGRGSEYYSQSTMHTIKKRALNRGDFLDGCITDEQLSYINKLIKEGDLMKIKCALPEGFLQTRACCVSYPMLAQMYHLRKNHGWEEWSRFFNELLSLAKFPELIKGGR